MAAFLARIVRAAPRFAPLGLGLTAAGAVTFASGEDHVEPPKYSWSHHGPFSSFDAAACVALYGSRPNRPLVVFIMRADRVRALRQLSNALPPLSPSPAHACAVARSAL
jgi:hypothetical protein